VARAHIYRPIIGANGGLLYGATVTVEESGLSVPLGQPMYSSATGSTILPNPFVASQGVIDFWVEIPQRVSILAQAAQHADIRIYVDALPSPDTVVLTDQPLEITGQALAGYLLQATGAAGQAAWAPAPSSTGISPLVTIINQGFTNAADPSGWTFLQAATTTRNYQPVVPPNQGWVNSMHAVHTGNAGDLVTTLPGFTLLQPGSFGFWLKPNLAAGESVVISVTLNGGTKQILETISNNRDWGYYSYPLAAGTYLNASIEFVGAATFVAGAGHEMFLTGVSIVYGGQVSAHNHAGSGANSVALGANSTATASGSTALGANAAATGANALAAGFNSAAAGNSAVAIGQATSAAADHTVAVGDSATGNLANVYWLAVGAQAYADGAYASAVGFQAKAYGPSSTALGNGAYTASAASGSLAAGYNARANAANSLALGSGATVNQQNSAAIGANALTSALYQMMLGSAAQGSQVVIPGTLRAVGAVNLGTDSGSRVGFYGSEGTTQPVVTGSTSANAALQALLGALNALGLISNQTT
jgi:hypothetical protein